MGGSSKPETATAKPLNYGKELDSSINAYLNAVPRIQEAQIRYTPTDNAIQAASNLQASQDQAANLIALQKQYGAQYAKAQLDQARMTDPTGFALREKTQGMVTRDADPFIGNVTRTDLAPEKPPTSKPKPKPAEKGR